VGAISVSTAKALRQRSHYSSLWWRHVAGNVWVRATAEKFSGGGGNGKNKTKNSTIKPFSTLSVSCMKTQGVWVSLMCNVHIVRYIEIAK